MMKSNTIKQFINNQSLYHPIRTIFISLFFTLFIFMGGKNYFVIDDDFYKLFPKDMESKKIWDDMQSEFGQTEYIFIAFGQLGKNIYDDPAIFTVSTYLTNALDSLPNVDRVVSISSMNKFESKFFEGDTSLEVGKIQDEDFLRYVHQNEQDSVFKTLSDIKTYFKDHQELKNRFISTNDEYLNIAVRPIKGINVSDLTSEIHAVTDRLVDLNIYDIHFGGKIYITGEIPNIIADDVRKLMAVGLMLMIIILLVNIRNVVAVGTILITIVCSFLSMIGFMGWMYRITGSEYFYFTMMSTSMPIILLTIANSDGVHIISRFFKELRRNENTELALKTTMDSLLLPIFLTSFTTSVAFLAMVFSPLPHMLGYATGIAFGIMWAFVLSSTLLPSLLRLAKWDTQSAAISKPSMLENMAKIVSQNILYHPKRILLLGTSIVLISSVGLWMIQVEVNIIKFFKPGHTIRESTEFIDHNFSGTSNITIQINSDFTLYENYKKIKKLENFFDKNEKIKMSISFLDIIDESFNAYNGSNGKIIMNQDQLDGVYSLLSMSSKEEMEDELRAFLGNEYDDGFYDIPQMLITAMMGNYSTMETQEIVKEVNDFVDNDLRADDLDVKISGMAVFINDFVDLVVKSSLIGIVSSIILILLITWVFFRSLMWGLLSIIPLLAAVILNFGLMGIFGVHLSHLTALLSSVIIGVGVDFSIHYISDYKRNVRKGYSQLDISKRTSEDVGYPILLDVGSNMGFISLLFSALIPLNYMGGLMVFAMLSTSLGTLTILASIIELLKPITFRK